MVNINLNGTEYVDFETYKIAVDEQKKAYEELESYKKDNKEVVNDSCASGGIMDVCNVSKVFHIPEQPNSELLLYRINNSDEPTMFKFICDSERVMNNGEYFYIMDKAKNIIFKGSFKWLSYFKSIIKGLNCSDKRDRDKFSFSVFCKFKDNEFIKDFPCILVNGNYGMILAPRVEND